MRRVVAIGLCFAAAACGIEPARPMLTGANEIQPRSGLFTGPTGEVLLIGVEREPDAPAR